MYITVDLWFLDYLPVTMFSQFTLFLFLYFQDLRMQLANESKTIETLKAEYLVRIVFSFIIYVLSFRLITLIYFFSFFLQTYKKDMETRLKHCAKIYAKMSLKLRQLSNEGRK